jgi:integrase
MAVKRTRTGYQVQWYDADGKFRKRTFLRDDPLVAIRPLREPRADVDPFSPEEVAAFLAACPAYWRPYFTVAFWTGVRPGELAALKWGDVDLSRGSLRIRAGRYRGHEGSPRTESSVRDIDLLVPVVEVLQTQRATQAAARLAAGQGLPDPGRDYVFTMPSGRCVDPNRLREQRLEPHHRSCGRAAADDVPNSPHLRVERLGGRRGALLGSSDARTHDARDALSGLRSVHPQPDASGRQRARRSDDEQVPRRPYSRFTPVERGEYPGTLEDSELS